MKANKFFIGMASLVAAMTFTACSQDEAELQQSNHSKGSVISLTYQLAQTRAASDPQTTALSTSNKVGVYVSSSSSTLYNNVEHSVGDAGALTATTTMNYPTEDGATVNIYAYAPYASSLELSSDNAFSVSTDQSAESGYLASDLVYASKTGQASTSDAVSLTFAHKLSQLQIIVQKDDDIDISSGATVYLTGTNTAATFNPSTGTVAAATTTNVQDIKVATITAAGTVYAIAVPQEITANTELVKIVTNDKTYKAKLTSGATLTGGKAYSFTVKLVASSSSVVEVPISLTATSITEWGTPTDLGSADMEEVVSYEVGDYVLTDGTFVKASALTDTQKSSVAGIIFSTTVSTTDAAAGYNAYAMGINRQKQAFHNTSENKSQMVTDNKINELAEAIADLDGLTRTTTMLSSAYYTALTDDQKAASMINLSWYSTTKSKAISANASAWYLPSFGQLVQIMNNLGGANFTTYDFGEGSFTSSSTYTVSTSDELTTIAGKIQAYVTAAGGQSDMFTVGNINYPSSTENGSTSDSHYGKVFSINFTSSAGWNFGKALGRTDSQNYSVIPVVAVKLPTE